jgi:hypothetical protein
MFVLWTHTGSVFWISTSDESPAIQWTRNKNYRYMRSPLRSDHIDKKSRYLYGQNKSSQINPLFTMILLSQSEYPKDFHYHRTSSPTYRIYLEGCGPKTFDIDTPHYAWKKSLLSLCHISRFERTDIEPDIETLKNL